MANYFNFPNKKDIKDHSVFAEELLVPFLNHSDAYRINMFSSHFSQLVHLKTPEYPKVFTNFENQVGEYSLSYKKAENDFEIIAKIPKNALNYDLIVKYKSTGVYDYIPVRYASYITEEYGCHMDDCLIDKEVGDVVKKDEFIYKAPNYDDAGNFRYGVNLKAVYHQYEGITDEDAVVISQSAADKLVSYKVEETFVSVNTNDILLNIYPTEEYGYHSIPKVGENTLGRILCASRRQDSSTALYTFQHDKMSEISDATDDITYSNGAMVADMDIYCNIPIEQMRKRRNEFNREVVSLLEEQHRYYKELAAALESIIPIAKEEELLSVMNDYEKTVYDNERKEYGYHFARPLPKQLNENKYSDNLAFAWKQAHEYLDSRIKWRVDGKAFHNLKIRFLLVKENPVTVGLKLTGRYGNKGIVARIVPDESMPTTEDGLRAEICLNAQGVWGRINPSQLYELHINFMSDHVVKLMSEAQTTYEKEKIYFEYLKEINPKEHDFFENEFMSFNRAQKEDFLNEIIEKGIYIHEPPFFGNTSFQKLKEIMKNHPEWCSPYKCEGIYKPMIIGDEYFIRLRHEASNKTSVCSSSMTNPKNLPSKSALKKNHKVLFAKTPIRLGDMEMSNLLITCDGEMTAKLAKSYATSKDEREKLIEQLLTSPNPFNIDVEVDNNKSINRTMLEKYLEVLELGLENTKIK